MDTRRMIGLNTQDDVSRCRTFKVGSGMNQTAKHSNVSNTSCRGITGLGRTWDSCCLVRKRAISIYKVQDLNPWPTCFLSRQFISYLEEALTQRIRTQMYSSYVPWQTRYKSRPVQTLVKMKQQSVPHWNETQIVSVQLIITTLVLTQEKWGWCRISRTSNWRLSIKDVNSHEF